MKKYKNFASGLSIALLSTVLLTSCNKVDQPNEVHEQGKPIVRITGGGPTDFISTDAEPSTKSFNVDFVNTSQTLAFAEITRDVPSSASLNTALTVTISDDTTALRVYNDSLEARGENPLVYLPAAYYTVGGSTPKTGAEGGTFKITFAPGEFAKQISISIPDATQFDPSTVYALAFTITAVDASGTVIGASRTLISTVGAKNQYDGRYAVTGTLVDVSAAGGLFGPWLPSWEADLVTIGASSNDVYDETYTGGVFHPFFSDGVSAPSYYGTFGMEVTFDPATNKMVSLVSPYVPAANTRYAALEPTYNSYFDPATHNIKVKYYMFQPSVVAVGPRVTFTETWTYIGPR